MTTVGRVQSIVFDRLRVLMLCRVWKICVVLVLPEECVGTFHLFVVILSHVAKDAKTLILALLLMLLAVRLVVVDIVLKIGCASVISIEDRLLSKENLGNLV